MSDEAIAKARAEVAAMPGLKEDELRSLGNCCVCGKPQLSGSEMTFYEVTVRRAAYSPASVRRRVGLELMLGSAPLARIMGPDEDLAKVFATSKVFVHESCAGMVHHVLDLTPTGGEG